MNYLKVAGLMLTACAAGALAQQSAKPQSNVEMTAIVNLRRFALAESSYAMGHPEVGFACDPQDLTKLEWPRSAQHAPLVAPELLTGKSGYKFSARCLDKGTPAKKIAVFAVPLDPALGLRTFCATGRFATFPSNATSEFPIHAVSAGDGEACLKSGKPLS